MLTGPWIALLPVDCPLEGVAGVPSSRFQRDVVAAVHVPVQAVGGLTIDQVVATSPYSAPLVVLGAPPTIDADTFRTASGDVAA